MKIEAWVPITFPHAAAEDVVSGCTRKRDRKAISKKESLGTFPLSTKILQQADERIKITQMLQKRKLFFEIFPNQIIQCCLV